MSDFSGYEKMPTSLKKLGLSESDYGRLDKYKWVVTEKVHGANFSFVYEDNQLKYAKRKEYLTWQDDFFGFQEVVVRIENKVLQLFENLSAAMSGDQFMIYGELFGGEYPHPDVPEDPNVKAVQTGVYYSPMIQFCAFDIALVKEGIKYYLDYKTAISYFDQHEIIYAKPLKICKFNEAMAFDTRINSSIPTYFGLPALEENLIEGVVLKTFNQSDEEANHTRPIIKLKNAEFEEEQKFHEAQKWTYVPNISSNTEALTFLVDELRKYVTANRLESAISKIGALDFNNSERISAVKKEFSEDTITDFEEDNPGLLNDLTEAQLAWVKERLQADITKMVH
ncbi:MAG: 2'-5' RNA ligase [Reichenbachiella sp.]